MPVPGGSSPGMPDDPYNTASNRGNMSYNETDGDMSTGNGSGIRLGTGTGTEVGKGMTSGGMGGKGMSLGMGMGIGIGMGKGGKGSIASMGFAHPSHRLALLSGHVHQVLLPNKIAQRIRTAKEEEMLQIANAAIAREAVDKELEIARQGLLQVLDKEQQIAHAAAQSAASAARFMRLRPIYSHGSAFIPHNAYPGPNGQAGAVDMSSRSLGPASNTVHHSLPAPMHHHNNSSGPLQRVGSQNHLPAPIGTGVGVGGIPPIGTGYVGPNYAANSLSEKEGYVKPMTAAAVLTAAMSRVSSNDTSCSSDIFRSFIIQFC